MGILKNAVTCPANINKKIFMKGAFVAGLLIAVIFSCTEVKKDLAVEGTWKLISGTLVEKGDTTVTDYTKNVSFIKIINGTHFAFLQHDLNKGKDSSAVYSSGAGTYSLVGNKYSEHLEYCSAREWEDN